MPEHTEGTHNGRTPVVAKLPETSEYTVKGLAVRPYRTDDDKATSSDTLVTNHADGGSMLFMSLAFVERRITRRLDKVCAFPGITSDMLRSVR